MNLREEIGYVVWNGETKGSVGAALLKDKVDNLMGIVKKWALEMVGEDVFMKNWPDQDGAENAAKEEIRQRIEENIKL